MRRLKLPWWKKLWDEDDAERNDDKENAEDIEQLNF